MTDHLGHIAEIADALFPGRRDAGRVPAGWQSTHAPAAAADRRFVDLDAARVEHFAEVRKRAVADDRMRSVGNSVPKTDLSGVWARNPWSAATFNLTIQSQVIRVDPRLAAALEKEAHSADSAL